MPIHQHIQGWRKARNYSIGILTKKSGIRSEDLEALEAGELDPPVSMLESLASGLGIPVAWLHADPASIKLLLAEFLEEGMDEFGFHSSDLVTEFILRGNQHHPDLYVLLTALLQSGEPKLLRAAEVNLRSLLKQAKTATVPWQSRPPGHFEPPSD